VCLRIVAEEYSDVNVVDERDALGVALGQDWAAPALDTAAVNPGGAPAPILARWMGTEQPIKSVKRIVSISYLG
jgi:hypothetical protein